METLTESFYTADKEMVDAIKLEYSSLSPGEQEKITDLALETRNLVIEEYGKYISPEIKIRFSTIENRVVVMSREDYNKFLEEWAPDNFKEAAAGSDKDAFLCLMGNIACIVDVKEMANKEWEKHKEILAKAGLEKEAVIDRIQYCSLIESMTHEFVHAAWNESSPTNLREGFSTLALAECGTSFITNELAKKREVKTNIFYRPYHDERMDMFIEILTKYGYSTYYVFFNNKPEHWSDERFDELKKSILSEFNSQVLLKIGLLNEQQVNYLDNLEKDGFLIND